VARKGKRVDAVVCPECGGRIEGRPGLFRDELLIGKLFEHLHDVHGEWQPHKRESPIPPAVPAAETDRSIRAQCRHSGSQPNAEAQGQVDSPERSELP
jgi:hypothetical protein